MRLCVSGRRRDAVNNARPTSGGIRRTRSGCRLTGTSFENARRVASSNLYIGATTDVVPARVRLGNVTLLFTRRRSRKQNAYLIDPRRRIFRSTDFFEFKYIR